MMKRIPLEQRLKAATAGPCVLGAFPLRPAAFFHHLSDMTADERFANRFRELRHVYPHYERKILSEIAHDAIDQSIEHGTDLLYVILVEPFMNELYIWEEDF